MSRQCAGERAQQRRLAAEQMGTAGDVEEQPVGRIERHQRREPVAPVGDIFQRLAIGGLVGIEHRQFRTHRAGIGQRQADVEVEPRRRIVDGINHERIVLLGDNDAWRIVRTLLGIVPSPLAGEG